MYMENKLSKFLEALKTFMELIGSRLDQSQFFACKLHIVFLQIHYICEVGTCKLEIRVQTDNYFGTTQTITVLIVSYIF